MNNLTFAIKSWHLKLQGTFTGNMTGTEPFNFAITDDPEVINSLYLPDERAKKLLLETFHQVNRKKKSIVAKLYGYINEYPEIPQFKNRLASWYQLTGNREKAKEINLLT